MTGDPWKELKGCLRNTVWKINKLSTDNKVTILNFSSDVLTEYANDNPKLMNLDCLTFQGYGTDFEKVFESGYDHIKTVKANDIVLTFMTDGQAQYPRNALKKIKEYTESAAFRDLNIKFSYSGVGFQCNSSILKDIAEELGGTIYYAENEEDLNDAFLEILNKNID